MITGIKSGFENFEETIEVLNYWGCSGNYGIHDTLSLICRYVMKQPNKLGQDPIKNTYN